MERKRGKCWKSPIFEGKLWVFISYLSEMKIVCSMILLYSSTFYSFFVPFFVLEIFKFKYDKVFIRHSASISKFKWFEQPWYPLWVEVHINIWGVHWIHLLILDKKALFVKIGTRIWVLDLQNFDFYYLHLIWAQLVQN